MRKTRQRSKGPSFDLIRFLQIVNDEEILPLKRPEMFVKFSVEIPPEFEHMLKGSDADKKLLALLEDMRKRGELVDFLGDANEVIQVEVLSEENRLNFPKNSRAHTAFLRKLSEKTSVDVKIFLAEGEFEITCFYGKRPIKELDTGTTCPNIETLVEDLAELIYDKLKEAKVAKQVNDSEGDSDKDWE